MTGSFKKALVTGGAGFIGSHLAKALLEQGLQVAVIDNLSTGTLDKLPSGVEFIQGDILDDHALSEAISDVEIVFHNAARVSIRSSIDAFYEDAQTNVMGTLRLLKACSGTKVSKFVLASSMAVYADSTAGTRISENHRTEPISPYGVSKLASERYCLQICEALGVDAVILRYFNTYGINQAFTPYVGVITIFITKLLAGEAPTIFGDGQQVRDFVSVRDIVRSNLRAMSHGPNGAVFNIGSGRPATVKRIADLLIEKINPTIEPRFAQAQPAELRHSVADISNASAVLGYEPEGSLEQDIDAIIAHIESPRT